MTRVRQFLTKLPLVAALTYAACSSTLSAQTEPKPLTTDQILKRLAPDMAEVVLLYDAIKGSPLSIMTGYDGRQQFSPLDAAKIIGRASQTAPHQRLVGPVYDGLTVPGSDGNEIPIRIYVPPGLPGPFNVIVYFHGGGFVTATIDTYDASARALCDDTTAIVVSVEYRKAPEAPYPAALHDAISAYKWVTSNIGRYAGDTHKVALAGESAGANLAAEVAIAARDQQLQKPAHQMLIYPVASSDLTRPSDFRYQSDSLPLNTAVLAHLLDLYLANPAQKNDPGVSLLKANLEGLPSTTIIAAEIDPLLGDGVALRNKLWASGNSTYYRVYPGVTHEFFGMDAAVGTARQAQLFAAQMLIQAFARMP